MAKPNISLPELHSKIVPLPIDREEILREYATIIAHIPMFILIVNKNREIKKMNNAALQFLGKTEREVIGRRGGEALNCIHHLDDPMGCGAGQACRTCKIRQTVQNTISSGNNHHQITARLSILNDTKPERVLSISTALIDDTTNDVIVFVEDITETIRYQESLKDREKQHAALARLSQLALASECIDMFLDKAIKIIHDTLNTDCSKILEWTPSENNFLLKSGLGWTNGLVGKALVDADFSSQAGYTLHAGKPVVVDDLNAETRFVAPDLLKKHGITSGISIIIGPEKTPYGVLGCHSVNKRRFNKNDVNFVQSAANVIAQSIVSIKTRNYIKKSTILLENLSCRGTLAEKASMITQGIADIFELEFARIWLLRPGDDCKECIHSDRCINTDFCLHLVSSSERYKHINSSSRKRVPVGAFKVGTIYATEKDQIVNGLINNDSFEDQSWIRDSGMLSFGGFRLLSPDGEPMGVLAFFSRQYLTDEQHTFIKSLVNASAHVIHRAQIESELSVSEKNLKRAQKLGQIGNWTWEMEPNVIQWSDEIYKIFGMNKQTDRVTYEAFLSKVHPDDLENVTDSVSSAIEKGCPYGIDHRILHEDGTIRYVHEKGQIIYDKYTGSPIIMEGTVQDITERKKIEEKNLQLISDLKDAITKVKLLRGLLPICSHCKKIRDDKGYWNHLEYYISQHSDAEFTHSICDDCFSEHYPDDCN